MARLRRYMNLLNGWDTVIAGVEAHATELPHLEMLLPQLKEFLQIARSLSAEQVARTADKQEATKKLKKVIREGEALAVLMCAGARQYFGNDSEMLVKFGLQPFRGRSVKADEATPATPTPENPDSPTPTPTPEATE